MDGEGSSTSSIPEDKHELKLAIVIVGIALFVLGFVITVSSFSSGGVDGEDGTPGNTFATGTSPGPLSLLMITGMVVSFTGVLIATVGPMASFIQGRAR